MNDNLRLVSAVLFLNPNGITLKDIAKITHVKEAELVKTLDKLSGKYRALGLELVHQNDKYVLLVANVVTAKNQKLINDTDQLSSSAMEVLSIISYKQPISRDEIESIRGIGSEQSIRGLLEKELIEETRKKIDGIVHVKYITTVLFLKQLGIRSLDELPKKN